jgi:hypothetical protein
MINDKLKDLYTQAGFSTEIEGKWPNMFSVGSPLQHLVTLIVNDCAEAAALHANSYADGDAGTGSIGAANAVRAYGASLFK